MNLSNNAKMMMNHDEFALIINEMSELVPNLVESVEANAKMVAVYGKEDGGVRSRSQTLVTQAKV